jgi:hypothetical protein
MPNRSDKPATRRKTTTRDPPAGDEAGGRLIFAKHRTYALSADQPGIPVADYFPGAELQGALAQAKIYETPGGPVMALPEAALSETRSGRRPNALELAAAPNRRSSGRKSERSRCRRCQGTVGATRSPPTVHRLARKRHGSRRHQPLQRQLLPGIEHGQSRYLNNRAENSHRPTRRRERQVQRFKSPRQDSAPSRSFLRESI